jgi:AraC-like DNA-binding protein
MPAAYFRLVLRHFGRTPELAAQIVEGTGIDAESAGSSDPGDVIRLEQLLRQVRNVLRVVGPDWAIAIGPRLGAAAHGDLAAATASAPDLGAALSLIERFAYVRAPYFELTSASSRSFFELRVQMRIEMEPEVWVPLLETLLLSIQAVVESALGEPMEQARFEMDFDPPAYSDRYADVFHAPVVFGSRHTCVRIPSSWIALKCPFADSSIHRRAVDRLEVAARNLQGPEFIVSQVERILGDSAGIMPNVSSIATQLRLSRRTLVRRLEHEGTSFRSVLEAHRRRRSLELLADPSLDVSEIADRLGYSEPSNFSRAFRRWFDKSPREYRDPR